MAQTEYRWGPQAELLGLINNARTHPEKYLASQSIAWVNTFPNMHKGSDGKLAWDNGGPISRAGYNSRRPEIVATGFSTAADAIRFWMQDDAPSRWWHRNLVLNCAIQEAGADHLQGCPYWTVDMGTR
jgi:hypothetical protein